MAEMRFTGLRVHAVAFVLSILVLLASALFALAQENALFQRIDGVAADLSADQQNQVAKLQGQGIHQALEYVRVDPGVLGGSRVSMALADGEPAFTLLERIDRAPNDYTWIGTIPGSLDQAVLVVRNGEVTGQVDRFAADGSVERFSLTPLGGNLHALAEIDFNAFQDDHRPGPLPVAPRRPVEQRTDAEAGTAGEQAAADGIQVDVLVAYTPEAEAASANIHNAIQLAVDLANAGYVTSDANTRLRLVGTEKTTGYSEIGKTYDDLLYQLTGSNGSSSVALPAAMSAIHVRRNALSADLVSLFVNHADYCGLAWINSSVNFGFSVVTHSCVSNHTFAHELGHNFGALHDVASSGGVTPPYAYGHGYIHPGNLWRTIQSYAAPCGNCPRINQFSNPGKTYNGAVTGTVATHDVARVHRERVPTVAAFRSPVVEPGIKAEVISPVPGSTLSTATATFQWNTGSGVTEYWLDVVATHPTTHTVYNASTGTETSRTLTGLPAAGALNVRLWSLIGGAWQHSAYTYTMATQVKAVMSTPAQGSTLTSTTATFDWSVGTGVTEYWLYIGTTRIGSFDVYNKTAGTAQSVTVTDLPVSGTLYVRLFSRIAGAWQHNDYTYTMSAGTAKAAMISPTPGTTLTTATATFSWTAGTGVAEYWLYVGTTGAGSFDVYNKTTGTARSTAVSGLPASGTMYVRLFSRIGTVWQHNDYSYTMNAVVGKARISSPTPGAALTSNAATFTWTVGIGVSEYWFTVGTTGVGAGNIVNASTGMARSRTVSGLPATGTLYVRLWSMMSGVWQYTDYTYTMSLGGIKASMNTPEAGSILYYTQVAFGWSAGTGISEYWLTAGTTGAGSGNIYNQSTGLGRSRLLSGLPATGTLYVRLWSMISGVWQYTDYTYTMNVGAPPEMVSPTPGATLPSTSATFRWTRGTDVYGYELDIGTTGPGSKDIASVSQSSLSYTAQGLPASGTIYVRLSWMAVRDYVSRDYTYTAGGGIPISSLITPSQGSMLSNSTNFEWQPVSGATEYWIDFGYTEATTGLYNGSQGTATSATFNFSGFDGETVYMRLWTLHGGTWRYVPYTFRGPGGDVQAARESPPRITASRIQSASAQ